MRRGLAKVPPFTSEPVREGTIAGVRAFRRSRARAFEASGSDRFSAPANDGMDRRLAELLGAGGFFVEAGANDGFRYSNTYLLERFHRWRGVLVEPIPALYRRCVSVRPEAQVFHAALVARDFTGDTVRIRYGDLMSRIGGEDADANWGWERSYELDVPARTLSAILDWARGPAPDLLSLDVEGYEVEVLAGLDWDRHAPRALLLEVQDGSLERFGPELLERYEVAEWLSGTDVLVMRRPPPDA